MTAPFVYDGAMNGTVVRAYLEQVLVPALTRGDIVVIGQSQETSGSEDADP